MNRHAQALGRLAKGKPKNYTQEERERRRQWAAGMRSRKLAKRHPALALFESMFRKASATDSPENSGHLVPRSAFCAACWQAGIDYPKNVVDGWAYEERIGMQRLAKRLGRLRDNHELREQGGTK